MSPRSASGTMDPACRKKNMPGCSSPSIGEKPAARVRAMGWAWRWSAPSRNCMMRKYASNPWTGAVFVSVFPCPWCPQHAPVKRWSARNFPHFPLFKRCRRRPHLQTLTKFIPQTPPRLSLVTAVWAKHLEGNMHRLARGSSCYRLLAASACAALLSTAAAAATSGYHVLKSVTLGGEGGFDYLNMDPATGNLYITRGNHVM